MPSSAASRASVPHPAPVESFEFARAHAVGVEKARRNIVRLADRPLSGAFAADGNYFAFPEGFFDIGNWTSSFFTGMALLAFETTRDAEVLKQVNRLVAVYREKVTGRRRETMHDLGFLYSLYSVAAHRLTRDAEHRRTGLIAADELAKRFSARGGYLQAWGPMDESDSEYAGLAIIDCMMNLPLLFWATRETGSRFYHEIAVRHADATLANFIRADDSVCHAFRFDLATGTPVRADNYCGYAVGSHWARGTAWAIYGFALAYRHTRDARYLDASARVARKFVALLDAELVPVWDFRLPPGAPPLRDSSAAAIAVCGLDELTAHRPTPVLSKVADALLRRLCSETYLDSTPERPGILRLAEVGDGAGEGPDTIKPQSVYASWGDYFFMEALSRRLHATANHW
jgi:unsaturated chondroitin disaccharide hydrolase